MISNYAEYWHLSKLLRDVTVCLLRFSVIYYFFFKHYMMQLDLLTYSQKLSISDLFHGHWYRRYDK